MKPSFHARLVNGPFDDPCLYVRLLRESRALLFDAGFTTNLSARDILKTSDIFISHAHIDHFIGFDNILRTSLKKEGPLRFYGPAGIIDRIEGKLRGYSWNLIGEYPAVVEVSEVDGDAINKTVFNAKNSFKREDLSPGNFGGILLEDLSFMVSATVLDNQIPCLGFSIKEDYHINIDKAKLSDLNLPVGPWLGKLKEAIRHNSLGESISIEGREFVFADIKDIAHITTGQKISYICDLLGSEENILKAVKLAKGSDVLYIEAYFLDKDKDRARERYHLTAKQAGRIAREAGVARLEVFHFSPKYTDAPEELIKEAEREFRAV